MQKSNKIILNLKMMVVGFASIIAFLTLSAQQAEAACVKGVASNDVLNIRNGPGSSFAIVGFIRPGECGVVTGRRQGRWIYVDYGRGGYVNSKYLTGGGGGFQAYNACVRGVAYNDVLYVRSARTSKSRVVIAIPPNACNIWVRFFRGNWARVVFNGRTGWAAKRFLTR